MIKIFETVTFKNVRVKEFSTSILNLLTSKCLLIEQSVQNAFPPKTKSPSGNNLRPLQRCYAAYLHSALISCKTADPGQSSFFLSELSGRVFVFSV
jgi:hypothetical protein